MPSVLWIRVHDKSHLVLGDNVYKIAMELLKRRSTPVTLWDDGELEHFVAWNICRQWTNGFHDFSNYSDDQLRNAWKQVGPLLTKEHSLDKAELRELRAEFVKATEFLELVDNKGMTERKES